MEQDNSKDLSKRLNAAIEQIWKAKREQEAVFARALSALDVVWRYYRAEGSGRRLDEQRAGIVQRQAKFIVGFGLGRQIGWANEEIEERVGIGLLESENWDGISRQEAIGLEQRKRYLLSLVFGKKPIPWVRAIEELKSKGIELEGNIITLMGKKALDK